MLWSRFAVTGRPYLCFALRVHARLIEASRRAFRSAGVSRDNEFTRMRTRSRRCSKC